MKKPLSVSIIGAGKIAGGYDEVLKAGEHGVFTHAAAYKRDGRFHLTTVFDSNQDRARSFCDIWNVDSCVDSLEQVVSQFHDVISVCTPDITHEIIMNRLIQAHCCKTIFVEKPLGCDLNEMCSLVDKAVDAGINIVVNFQRQFDKSLSILAKLIGEHPQKILAVNAYYMKGLSHIGTTMLDTLCFLFGLPEQVLSYDRRWNEQVNEHTYEFVLYYESFNITVKTVDSIVPAYHYHVFDIDLLFDDRRVTINDNSRQMVIRKLTDYSYGGVKVLDDHCMDTVKTGYDTAMLDAVAYLYDITSEGKPHRVNLPINSIHIRYIVDSIIESFASGQRITLVWSDNEKS